VLPKLVGGVVLTGGQAGGEAGGEETGDRGEAGVIPGGVGTAAAFPVAPHPPLLFAAEIASPSKRESEVKHKQAIYEQILQVPEHLDADPEQGLLALWQWGERAYRVVPPDARGRVWSEQLALWFGYDEDGFLRLYTAEGEMLLTQEEELVDTRTAHLRFDIELLAEAWVPIEQELAIIVARRPNGQAVTYPLVGTVQIDGICREVLAPASVPLAIADDARRSRKSPAWGTRT